MMKSGGSWVFDNEIDNVEGDYENGGLVEVHDFDGYPMGIGYINDKSKIRVRILTRDIDKEIDRAFFEKKLRTAWDYRKKSNRHFFLQTGFWRGGFSSRHYDR